MSIDGASGHSLTDSPTLLTHATTYTTHNPQVIGKQVEERPVWGIDAYTRRMLEIVLDSAPDPMAPEARTAFIEKARGGRFLLAGLGCLVWFGCVLGACIGTCRRTLTDAAIIGPPHRHDHFLSKTEAAARHQHAAQGQGPRHGAGPHRARGGAYFFYFTFLVGWCGCAHTPTFGWCMHMRTRNTHINKSSNLFPITTTNSNEQGTYPALQSPLSPRELEGCRRVKKAMQHLGQVGLFGCADMHTCMLIGRSLSRSHTAL